MLLSVAPRVRHRLVVLALGPLLVMVLTVSAQAAEGGDSDDDDRAPVSLRVSPVDVEVDHTVDLSQHEIRVDNRGSEPARVVTELSEFTVTEDGATEFGGPDELSATSWVDVDVDEFELDPDERRDVGVSIDVPDDAEPGERYVSVIFAVPGDPDAEGNISVTNRVAVKLYIDVPGERIERLEAGELTGPRLIDSGPATFQLAVHNRGNVHQRFQEDGRLTATSGDAQFRFQNFTILADSTRVVEGTWADPPLVCLWCTVEVEVPDGQGGVVTASTEVVAFPLRLTLAVLVLAAGLTILTVAWRRRRAARFEQRLEQARREGAASRQDSPQPAAPTSAVPPPASGWTVPPPASGDATVPPPAPAEPAAPPSPPGHATVPPPPPPVGAGTRSSQS